MTNDAIMARRAEHSGLQARRARSFRSGLLALAIAVAALSACTTDEPTKEGSSGGGEAAAPVTNRIDIPPEVVRNLGIEFAQAERRHVDRTMRMPGAFESPSEAERNYRVPVNGRVDLKVSQYARVQAGDLIATVNSPEWRAMQSELSAAANQLADLKAELAIARADRAAQEADIAMFPKRIAGYHPHIDALEKHHAKLEARRDHWQARVTELEDLLAKGAAKATDLAEARGNLADAAAELSGEEEAHAELERLVLELQLGEEAAINNLKILQAAEDATALRVQAAEGAFALKLKTAASLLDVPDAELAEDAWRNLTDIQVKATAPGMVMDLHVTNGELIETGDSLCHVLDGSKIRFRARGLQADLGKLKNGLSAWIVPPAGGTLQNASRAEGTVFLAPTADADSRLVDVIVAPQSVPEWARPGVSAELEIVWDQAEQAELAVPNRALTRDGLDTVMFVRDPRDKNKVVRTLVETGPTDGRWTVVYSGVMSGSEVVVEGTYELKLTGSGKPMGEGHFHADGTWHAGKHSDDE